MTPVDASNDPGKKLDIYEAVGERSLPLVPQAKLTLSLNTLNLPKLHLSKKLNQQTVYQQLSVTNDS